MQNEWIWEEKMKRLACYLLFGAVGLASFVISDAVAKDKVTIAYIGSLTGGTSHIGLGGRNSIDLAIRLRNEDPKSKYEYQLVSLDDECKPNIGVQAVTKAGADRSIVGA